MIDKKSRLPQLEFNFNPVLTSKPTAKPRYAININGNTLTWSGRGRIPQWFINAHAIAIQRHQRLSLREFIELHTIETEVAA